MIDRTTASPWPAKMTMIVKSSAISENGPMAGRNFLAKNSGCRSTTTKNTRVTIAAASGMPAMSAPGTKWRRAKEDADTLRDDCVANVDVGRVRRVEDADEEDAERREEHELQDRVDRDQDRAVCRSAAQCVAMAYSLGHRQRCPSARVRQDMTAQTDPDQHHRC